MQNAFVESFNGKFRNECLSDHWFVSLEDARRKIEAWRQDYIPQSGTGRQPRLFLYFGTMGRNADEGGKL